MSNEELVCGKLEHRKKYPDCEKCATKIAAIVAAFKGDASHTKKKKKRDLSLHKRIKEVDAKQSFSDGASPYWSHLFGTQSSGAMDGQVAEDMLANPDVLSDESDLYNRSLSEEGDLRLRAIHEALADCTDRQRKILEAAFQGVWSEVEGRRIYTKRAVADELGMAQATMKTQLARIREKVQRRYITLKAARG